MTLRIPPVSGVIYSVLSGDTLSEIALHYGVDVGDIVRVNNLHDAASIKKGMELMIPGAARDIVDTKDKSPPKTALPKTGNLKPIPTAIPYSKPTVIDTATGLKSRYAIKNNGGSHGFAWGNCTWYVAQNKSVNWR